MIVCCPGGWTPPSPADPAARVVAGTPAEVRDALLRIAARYGVGEILAVTVTHAREARLRSYELLAEAMELG